MDNLSSHKRASVHARIEAAGARLMFLPPYSPDFDPIKKAFARLKASPPPLQLVARDRGELIAQDVGSDRVGG